MPLIHFIVLWLCIIKCTLKCGLTNWCSRSGLRIPLEFVLIWCRVWVELLSEEILWAEVLATYYSYASRLLSNTTHNHAWLRVVCLFVPWDLMGMSWWQATGVWIPTSSWALIGIFWLWQASTLLCTLLNVLNAHSWQTAINNYICHQSWQAGYIT